MVIAASAIALPALTSLSAADAQRADIRIALGEPVQPGPTFTVTKLANADDGVCTTDDCSLREALNAANASQDANTIQFTSGLSGTIPVVIDPATRTGLTISAPLTIVGPGARLLALSGEGQTRVVFTNSDVSISGLTLTNGRSTNGGAVTNAGRLTMTACTISNSTCVVVNDFSGHGAGMYNAPNSTVSLVGCTISGNQAPGSGGGLFNNGTFNATNCTFTGNRALSGGGILSLTASGTSQVTLLNCTITGNTATATSGGPNGGAGGYYADGNAQQHRVGNSIIAGNTNSINQDIRGPFTSEGDNLIGNAGSNSSGFQPGFNGDLVGVSPEFGSFANHGGPTNTWSLLASSPAVDQGNDARAPATDQRGFGRAGTSDMGAFELNGVPPAVPLLRVVSRKTHGSGGAFDLQLPTAGNVGVECRADPVSGNHTLVFTFANPLTTVGGASVTGGVGSVSSSGIGTNPREYVVNLAGVANAQVVTVSLTNVNDSNGAHSSTISSALGVLLGDTNGDRAVNSGDALQTRNRSGQAASASNFQSDINVDGSINAGDASVVRARSGDFIP